MTFKIVECETEQDDVRWDRYVLDHPRATGYHLTAWRKVIEKVFGHRTEYLFAEDERGSIRGVLPLAVLSSPLFGTFAISLPAVNYGGVVADDPQVERALLDSATNVARYFGANHIELRQPQISTMDWPSKHNKVSMRLPLPSHYDALWGKYSSKLRSQIRRAQKEGMVTQFGGPELVGDFYGVFSKNMRDLGTPVYSKGFFEKILCQFQKEARICVVYLKGQPVAAGFLYGFRGMIEIPWASSSREHNRLAPNMLLYSAALQYACESGYQVFDFGRSTIGGSTYRFKEQWGAKPVQLHWYYWLRDGQALPELNPQNPKYRLAIEAWKRLPLSLTTMLGPRISKYLP